MWRGTRIFRTQARQAVFDCIEMFFIRNRKRVRNGMLRPAKLERRKNMDTKGIRKSKDVPH